ncbi:putative receptor protein kinase ZmPK1 [Ricinus communis]|uniref:Receptor-like serine/threonine-protein kinase n=1 Tax=Ricinus communis TaxID=3988 RepID=B9SBW6_RICCO|nr:putative receptor protein kinase ZmPK1 [Ricinus communis]EEF38944.1 serine-threonine protein kinase, plant-type, putative [Ricinus communis]|eukprot:XP_002523485.1 putative receptor protein kinase ZmPK1 [Ricinus communis]
MAVRSFFFALPLLLVLSSQFLSSASNSLREDSFLSVENTNDVLTSPHGAFVAGFFPVGDNAYCFAIWFSEPFCSNNCTVVWMANRDEPVNGKHSHLALLKSGNLILTDAGQVTVWATNTVSESSVQLYLQESGNLVLQKLDGAILWQSFDFPTNTLLPLQPITKDWQLVSSRSESNYSSGFFRLYFDNDNVLRLLYAGPETSSIYWPDPELLSWEAGRSTYNNSRIAYFDSLGKFSSSDDFTFFAADYGVKLQRRLTIDFDGNLRLYSRKDGIDLWTVSWQAMSQPCRVHGICGPNSVCNYVPSSGRKCSCLEGFKMKDVTDWSLGCEPEYSLSCSRNESTFLVLTHVEFYGYDFVYYPNYTFDMCENVCLQRCDCKGFQLKFIKHDYPSNIPYCFAKSLLLNGHHSPSFEGDLYLKVPKTSSSSSSSVAKFSLDCFQEVVKQVDKVYTKSHENGSLKFVFWFAIIIGIIEFTVIFLVWYFLIRTHQHSGVVRAGYLQIATGFRKFSYSELKKATRGFREEIGRGAGGIVYKGILSDHRVAAIKRLIINEADQGEAEFRAEVSVIGKLNHMNLIEMWGYCAEGSHRLLVYKYMEHGSLAQNLSSNKLDWERRYDIALGTAKGLAYLHEECLEWVLHCDVKPQNILLDSDYQPKVSDFGLSHPLKRDSHEISRLSRIRGTRGYIAPEWIFNLPITSKVDVYSYGMVLLEIVTGKSPAADIGDRGLVKWVRKTIDSSTAMIFWMEKIVDLNLGGKYDKNQMEILIGVALKCAHEDKDARPTMRQVVEMLLQDGKDTKPLTVT